MQERAFAAAAEVAAGACSSRTRTSAVTENTSATAYMNRALKVTMPVSTVSRMVSHAASQRSRPRSPGSSDTTRDWWGTIAKEEEVEVEVEEDEEK